MKNVFFNKDILEAERLIIKELNIPSILLMENAGKNSADIILKVIKKSGINDIIVLSGKGNNAGDAFVISRHLVDKKIKISIISLYPFSELTGDAEINYNVLKSLNSDCIRFYEVETLKDFKKTILAKDLERSFILLDAVYGIGFKGELESRIKDIFNFITLLQNVKIIAIDTISGLKNHYECNNLLKADLTITMSQKKFNTLFNKGKELSGEIICVPIGIPEECFKPYNKNNIYEIEEKDLLGIIPKRNINSHKYNNGKVFILGGSPGFTGAVYLSSLAALRMGSGAVILGLPDSIHDILEIKTTEVITVPFNSNLDKSLSLSSYNDILKRVEWSDVTLIGPGIGRHPETMELVRKLTSTVDANYVIDADGIFAFKDNLEILKRRKNKIILTPHYGEFSLLTGYSNKEITENFYELSKEFAKLYNVILVLKNAPSVITDGEYFYINSTGRENLATIGSGDVLSGIIASAYSLCKNPINSALIGCYIHGRCGDILFDKFGSSSTIAGDLLSQINQVKMELNIV